MMHKRGRIVLAVAVLAAILLVLYGMFGGKGTAKPPAALVALELISRPAPVPAISFGDSGGRVYDLSAYRGRYVLLNLWASWCAPCVQELPALAALQRTIPPQHLAVLTVNVEKDAARLAAEFLIKHDAAELPAFIDPERKLMAQLKAYGLPTTLLIDPEGNEIARAIGPAEWGHPTAIAYFEALTVPPKRASEAAADTASK